MQAILLISFPGNKSYKKEAPCYVVHIVFEHVMKDICIVYGCIPNIVGLKNFGSVFLIYLKGIITR